MDEENNKNQPVNKTSSDPIDTNGTPGKRQRLISEDSPKFIVSSGMAASPPQFVTLEEIMNAADAVTNMHLAHEIAIDQDFRLEMYEPPQNSLEKAVKDMMHKAFWDILTEEINDDPPRYIKAMVLLEEIKTTLIDDVLLPQNTALKQEINETLDVPLIQQQAENGTLDFLGYAQYILGVMSKLCAPARDEKISELKKATDVVEIFKGILETLALMKLDLANFGIQLVRPNLIASSVEYEKGKFAELLKVDGGVDSLINTKKWLGRHVQKLASEASGVSSSSTGATAAGQGRNQGNSAILQSAYLELLEWNTDEPYPETVLMDTARLEKLHNRLYRLILTGSIILVTLSKISNSVLQNNQALKDKLREEISILLQGVRNDKELQDILPNVTVQVIERVKTFLRNQSALPESSTSGHFDPTLEKSLTDMLMELTRPDQPVRRIVRLRVMEFLQLALASLPNIPHQFPIGLTTLKPDVLAVTAAVIRLYKYNQAVFGEYYLEIIDKIKQECSAE